MDDALVPSCQQESSVEVAQVLILVVMDDALVLSHLNNVMNVSVSLNPCCNG